MDKRTTDIVCYCTWVGLLVAVLAGNREASRFHLNQSLVLGIFGLLGVIPCVGWVWAVFVAVWWCMGLTGAIRGVERPVPVLPHRASWLRHPWRVRRPASWLRRPWPGPGR